MLRSPIIKSSGRPGIQPKHVGRRPYVGISLSFFLVKIQPPADTLKPPVQPMPPSVESILNHHPPSAIVPRTPLPSPNPSQQQKKKQTVRHALQLSL